jgi:hypothetical protein
MNISKVIHIYSTVHSLEQGTDELSKLYRYAGKERRRHVIRSVEQWLVGGGRLRV